MVDKLYKRYSVSMLCWYLGCSRSGYYGWLQRGKPQYNRLDESKAAAVEAAYRARPSRGRRQVQMYLEHTGLHMSLGSVHRYMSILGLQSLRAKRKSATKKETQGQAHTFANVLQQDFHVSKGQPQKWLTDITYLPGTDGVQYLSCIKDCSDKSIVAYHFSNKNNISLVLATLQKALTSPKFKPGTILHSDQGHQYCSVFYHNFLAQHGFVGSMSRKACPQDNAPMESFFSILKNEELILHSNPSRKHTRSVVSSFVHFYNFNRPQMGLQKLAPIPFGSQSN